MTASREGRPARRSPCAKKASGILLGRCGDSWRLRGGRSRRLAKLAGSRPALSIAGSDIASRPPGGCPRPAPSPSESPLYAPSEDPLGPGVSGRLSVRAVILHACPVRIRWEWAAYPSRCPLDHRFMLPSRICPLAISAGRGSRGICPPGRRTPQRSRRGGRERSDRWKGEGGADSPSKSWIPSGLSSAVVSVRAVIRCAFRESPGL